MLVSHRGRFIYTKTAKTAGTSVEVYFEPWCFAEGSWSFAHHRAESITPAGIVGYRGPNSKGSRFYNHMSAEALREMVGPETWSSYFKFCVIRNPFDKIVSAFHWKHRETDTQEMNQTALVQRFRAWVQAGGTVLDRGQYTVDGELCLDAYIRYESLEPDLQGICQRLNLPWEPERLPRLKSGLRPTGLTLREYYDRATAERIRRDFAFEFEHFGYCPEL